MCQCGKFKSTKMLGDICKSGFIRVDIFEKKKKIVF